MLIPFANLVFNIWNTVFRGYVIKTFWVWFLLTLFPNLPALTILPAIGLSYVVNIFTPYRPLSQKEWEETTSYNSSEYANFQLINGYLHTVSIVLCLLVGYLVHLLM